MNDFGKRKKSAEIVLDIFSKHESLSQNEILELSRLSQRTIKSVIKILISSNEIFENRNFNDMRRKIYYTRRNKI